MILSEWDSTDGRAGASYSEDPGSSPASVMLQCALRHKDRYKGHIEIKKFRNYYELYDNIS